MHLFVDFKLNGPFLLILSRPLNDIATSVVSVMLQMPLFGRDMSLVELMSRQLNVVVTSFLWN